jgi:hypothetical protein
MSHSQHIVADRPWGYYNGECTFVGESAHSAGLLDNSEGFRVVSPFGAAPLEQVLAKVIR